MIALLPRKWYAPLFAFICGAIAIHQGWTCLHPPITQMDCADFAKQTYQKPPGWIGLHHCVLDYFQYIYTPDANGGIRVFGSKEDATTSRDRPLFLFRAEDYRAALERMKLRNIRQSRAFGQPADGAGPTDAFLLVETDWNLKPAEGSLQFFDSPLASRNGWNGRPFVFSRTSEPIPERPSKIGAIFMILIGVVAMLAVLGSGRFMGEVTRDDVLG